MAIGSATSLAVFPSSPATSAEVARALGIKPKPVALGRMTSKTVPGTMGVKPAPVALGRVTPRTIPGTMGIGITPSPAFAVPIKPPPSSGAGCSEPVSTRTLADGRPYRDPALVAAYLACVDRQRAASSPPIVAGSPIMVPAGLLSDPGPSFSRSPSSSSSSAPDAEQDGGGPAVVASTFGAHVEAPDGAWIAGGLVVLLLGGLFLHKKGVL